MAYDPRDIMKRLALLMGGVKGSAAESRGEYYTMPDGSHIRVIPVPPEGWNTREVWYKDAGTPNEKARFGAGEIPFWLKQGMDLINSASGKASAEDLDYLARHWIYGEGVAPGYQAAHDAMPDYAKEYVRQQLARHLRSGGGGAVGNQGTHPQ